VIKTGIGMQQNMNMILRALQVVVLLAASLSVISAIAQSSKDISALAAYEGADRARRLLEGAKKERELTLYGAIPMTDLGAITSAFEKKYGVKVKVWRSSSETLTQRITTEARSGQSEFDVVETNGQAIESLRREKLLQQVISPYLKDLIPEAVLPHHEWVGSRLDIFMQVYNTEKVKKTELPKSYRDLVHPRWNGRLGIEAEDVDWFATVVRELGEEKAIKLFKEIVATNGLSVRKGHSLLLNLVASGEIPLGLTLYNFTIPQLKAKGAPIQEFTIPPVVGRISGIGVSTKAPHPHAAILFYDFMISDAQQILWAKGYAPTSRKIETPANKMSLKFVDPSVLLDEGEKWTKLYADIFGNQSK